MYQNTHVQLDHEVRLRAASWQSMCKSAAVQHVVWVTAVEPMLRVLRANVVASSSPYRSCASFTEEVVSASCSSVLGNSVVGAVGGVVGAAAFAVTYGYNIACPVYEAYSASDDVEGG